MLNIPSYIEDPSYRYKMPALRIKVEGRGNGIRTNIPNIADVARSLGVPPEYPLRFFGAELGAQSKYLQAESKALLNGSHRQGDLQSTLDKFIEKFVLCPKCHLPEININVKKKRDLFMDCRSCGHVAPMDMSHKICSYIAKNPPPKSTMSSSQQVAEPKKHKKSRKSKKTEEKITLDSEVVQEAISRLVAAENKPLDELVQEISNISLAWRFEADLKFYVVLKGLFGGALLKLMQQEEMVRLLKEEVKSLQEDLLSAFAAVYVPDESFHKKVPTALKYFYDHDLLTEDFLLKWHNDQAVFNEEMITYSERKLQTLKELASEFLDWLENAEEEEGDSEEESESEEESQKPQEIPQPKAPQPEVSEEPKAPSSDIMTQLNQEEVDIDDI